ncbi:MAG: TonB family protein [Bryobacteraceae bacterium]
MPPLEQTAPGTVPPANSAPPQTSPKPVKQVSPHLPPNLRAMVSRQVEVQVRVTVDPTGKVTRTEPLTTQGAVAEYLQTAASNAARLWRFEPALSGGKPVPGELILLFRFLPDKR